MTRAEAYAEGFSEGARWAEHDIRNGAGDTGYGQELREMVELCSVDEVRAETIGQARGYRLTIARWQSRALTWEMLEHAPVNR